MPLRFFSVYPCLSSPGPPFVSSFIRQDETRCEPRAPTARISRFFSGRVDDNDDAVVVVEIVPLPSHLGSVARFRMPASLLLLLPPQTRYTKRPMSSACLAILELCPRRAFLFRRAVEFTRARERAPLVLEIVGER